MILGGQIVKLRPFKPDEKQLFFNMATNSEATPYLYGEKYGDKIPTWEELFDDFKDYFFDFVLVGS